ncbi:sugar nucleotide-binding protein [Bdellovibrio sp. HCB2-146]|uniref:sugar nucleotide-binding protein n=1 Tax=Bdellovibrio sp. HCB2-146 TaxID=3394362 RepID=UPI0039BCF76E
MSQTVLVLGSRGLLGAHLVNELRSNNHRVIGQSRERGTEIIGNPLDKLSLRKMIELSRPDVIVNLIAMTDVDGCQLKPDEAYKLNVELPGLLSEVCSHLDSGIRVVSISTDHVYESNVGATESDVTLRNIYALTKKWGEERSLCYPRTTVFRTNFVGKSISTKKSWTDWLVKVSEESISQTIFRDQFFNPISIGSLCRELEREVSSPRFGLYNLGANGALSKYEFANRFLTGLGLSTDSIVGKSYFEGTFTTPRPSSMVMDVKLYEKTRSVTLPKIENEIHSIIREYLDASAK